jgi:hypothetical protein
MKMKEGLKNWLERSERTRENEREREEYIGEGRSEMGDTTEAGIGAE